MTYFCCTTLSVFRQNLETFFIIISKPAYLALCCCGYRNRAGLCFWGALGTNIVWASFSHTVQITTNYLSIH